MVDHVLEQVHDISSEFAPVDSRRSGTGAGLALVSPRGRRHWSACKPRSVPTRWSSAWTR